MGLQHWRPAVRCRQLQRRMLLELILETYPTLCLTVESLAFGGSTGAGRCGYATTIMPLVCARPAPPVSIRSRRSLSGCAISGAMVGIATASICRQRSRNKPGYST